jgi:hypothetical protein
VSGKEPNSEQMFLSLPHGPSLLSSFSLFFVLFVRSCPFASCSFFVHRPFAFLLPSSFLSASLPFSLPSSTQKQQNDLKEKYLDRNLQKIRDKRFDLRRKSGMITLNPMQTRIKEIAENKYKESVFDCTELALVFASLLPEQKLELAIGLFSCFVYFFTLPSVLHFLISF